MLDFAFETVGVHRLEARSAVANGRGNGALRKMGAVQEGSCANRSCATASISIRCSVRSSMMTGDSRVRWHGRSTRRASTEVVKKAD